MLRRLTALLTILLLSPLVRADWTLTTADAPEQQHLTINTWDITEGLSLTNQSGTLVKTPTRNILALTSTNHPSPNNQNWQLSLRNGDVLLGAPVGFSGQSFQFSTPELGTIAIPLKSVLAMSPTKPTLSLITDSASDKDIVHFGNGDSMQGILANVDSTQLQLATGAEAGNAATTDIALKLIRQISFAGVTPPRTVPALSLRLTFISGTTLTVPLDKPSSFSWSINDILLNDSAGQPHKISSDQIISLEVLGGRVVSLTDLDPDSDLQTSFLGTHWPTQINKNVLGNPLVAGNANYAHGLGVHTRSTLTYRLDGSFDTLKLRVSLDDSAAPSGRADVSILLDGKVLWQNADLKAGTAAAIPSEELLLPIKNGKVLELRAAPPQSSNSLDILGRVNYLNPTLTRP